MPLPWILSILGVALISYKCTKVTPGTKDTRYQNVAFTHTYFKVIRPLKATGSKADHLVKVNDFKVKRPGNAVGPITGFYSQGDNLVLGANQFWGTGDAGAFENHFRKSLDRALVHYNSTCISISPSRISHGSCFAKFAEGFLVPKLIYRSHAFTCKVIKCKVKANLLLPISSWEVGLNSSLTKPQLLKLLDPVRFPVGSEMDSKVHKATITIKFKGPGTRHVWFQPLYWNLGGYFRNYNPMNTRIDPSQFYANITYPTRNRYTGLDGFYGLHDPMKQRYYTDTDNVVQVKSNIYSI